MDSVTRLGLDARGRVVVAGSHGGTYAAYLAAHAGARAVILNDAGVGMDGAGIAGLAWLGAMGMAGATVSHRSARIGNGQDMVARGVISHVNEVARGLGCAPGETVRQCADHMKDASGPSREPPEYREARVLLRDNPREPRVWALDSASLVCPEDRGQVLVTGSHGALLGGQLESALRVDALAAVFNDAGGGEEERGRSRLPVLDDRGIAAATVSAASARIGDGRSTYETGRLSYINGLAKAWGARPGATAKVFVDLVIARDARRQT